ncbi:hypothetical protein HBI38_030730 [Parastagonospora nodorum]|nr:hypothetical protein HBH72_148070 [Parastagonospora nodorum]KAH5166207.1 hypothetical protein HBI73_026020 [Parastagonospora nodorum]KAH5727281.1 hypothetical protein HBI20_064740 [Parastagonospora nodorum]KAH5739246.1 hypothetical protein HBI17_181660 [Parastagonospora nodorum]KAH6241050.1 hypothetical protein HBI15_016440 [Parastagonospora nodorum]
MVSAVVRSSLLTHNNTQLTHPRTRPSHHRQSPSPRPSRPRSQGSIKEHETRPQIQEHSRSQEALEAGSELDVARQFWRALGFEPTGMLTQLHCKDAQVQVETKKRRVKRRRGG